MDYNQNQEFDIIEDIDEFTGGSNQIIAARSHLQRNHIPEDFRSAQQGRVGGRMQSRPDLPPLTPSPDTMANMQAMLGTRQMPMSNPPRYGEMPHPGIAGATYSPPLVPKPLPPMNNGNSNISNISNMSIPMTSIDMVSPQNSGDSLSCRSVVNHVDNCPICSSYFYSREKIYWAMIAILLIMVFLLMRHR
jgi:hypothetical protein